MGNVFAYILQSSIVLAILYMCYKILLSSATFHGFKRTILLLILVISYILPLFIDDTTLSATAHHAQNTQEISGQSPVVEAGIPIRLDMYEGSEEISPWWSRIIYIYIIGCVTASIYLCVAAAKLWMLIHKGQKKKYNGYTAVVSEQAPGPFSWGKYIVYRTQDCDADLRMVLTHELRHISKLHWIDVLLCHVNIIFMWFTPAAYLLSRELKRIHEYEADNAIDVRQCRRYQLMLIKKSVGASFPTLANTLNHSQIYLRITMMMKNKSKSTRRLTALALPGAALLSIALLSHPAIAGVLNNLRHTDEQANDVYKITQNSTDAQITDVLDIIEDVQTPVSASDIKPANTADAQTSISETQESAVTTDKTAAEDVKAESPAIFVNGQLFTKELSTISPNDIASMTVVKDDPAYPQGKIMISLKDDNAPQDVAEQTAEFNGGQKALATWLTQNMQYPEQAIKDGLQGRVIVKFVVGKDGSVSSPVIMKGIAPILDNEAIRLVNAMPAWIPAKSNGKSIATNYVLPVTFKLSSNE